jgi:hypothetical protein
MQALVVAQIIEKLLRPVGCDQLPATPGFGE